MRKSRLSHYKQDRLIEHFVSGSTALTAASLCGVNRKTAAFYLLRLREIIALELEAESEAMFGGGAVDLGDEPVKGQMWFNRDWLDKHGLDPTQCAVIGVTGESMEPVLWDGSKILIDRQRTRWRKGSIFVVSTDDGLVVKRAGKNPDGQKMLVSEHPVIEPIPLPHQANIIGQVVWTARTLVGRDYK